MVSVMQCNYGDNQPVRATGPYLNCGHTYSFCNTHFTIDYAGYCPTCNKQKFCTWKSWTCGHSNITHSSVKYSCGHVWSLCDSCYRNNSYCEVFGGQDGGTRLP